MPLIKKENIASLTQLYEDNYLLPMKDGEAKLAPSAGLNEKVCMIKADLTMLEVDAIVNAANRTLLGGGGVDGRIHSVCGPRLGEECRDLDGCSTGDAKITASYGSQIGCKHIIHTVGPIYEPEYDERCSQLLASCYRRSLEVAVENDIKSIAFCAVSTGVYGYPSRAAATVAIKTVREFLEAQGQDADGNGIEKVVFCVYELKDEVAYRFTLPNFFPPAKTEQAVEPEAGEEVITTTTTTTLELKEAPAIPKEEVPAAPPQAAAPMSEAGQSEDEWVEVSKEDGEEHKP